jgi:hypothetical protein
VFGIESEVKNPFDMLPDKVLQLIFAAVANCKSLIQCMEEFRAHSERKQDGVIFVHHMSRHDFLICDQKLRGFYNMAKEFRALKSLVVRVGQAKDKPPSRTHCR